MPIDEEHINAVEQHHKIERQIKEIKLLIANCENMMLDTADPGFTAMHLAFIGNDGHIKHLRLPSDIGDELAVTLKAALENGRAKLIDEIEQLTIEE